MSMTQTEVTLAVRTGPCFVAVGYFFPIFRHGVPKATNNNIVGNNERLEVIFQGHPIQTVRKVNPSGFTVSLLSLRSKGTTR